MQILPHNEIDIDKWNTLVFQNERGPYDYSWYLDAVTHYWYVYVDENYTKGFAFATAKRLGIENVTIAPFVREHQFYGEWSDQEIEEAFQTIQIYFKGGIHQSNRKIASKVRTFQIVRKLKLDSHAVRNIQKAIKNNLSVREGTNFITSFSMLVASLEHKIPGFNREKQNHLKHLLQVLQDNNHLIIKEIVMNNELVGVLYFYQGKDRDVYIKGGANEIGKKLGAMYLAMNQQIEETLTVGKLFDFDGSEVAGVKRFNEYFNTEDEIYYQLSWDKNPWWYNFIRKIYLKLK
jgi:hypothetical protein